MIECSLAQECEGEWKGTGATNPPCFLCLAGSPSLHWDSLPLTLLQELSHWLTVKARADFKVSPLTYKALHGLAPTYLSDLVLPYIPTRTLW